MAIELDIAVAALKLRLVCGFGALRSSASVYFRGPRFYLSVHPTSFVDSRAEIAANVEIGPFVVVEAGVRIGQNSVVHGHAQLLTGVELGEECEVGHSAVLSAAPQEQDFDKATPSGVRIGSRNVIREHVTIHRSSKEEGMTEMGSDNLLMVGCHLGHDMVMGDRNILANHCLIGGHVKVGSGSFLGGGSGFHQFVRVGDLCMIKGLSAISQDVPPYVLASGSNRVSGLNVVGMRRAGFSALVRQNIKDAFHQMFLAGLNRQEALDSTLGRVWEPEGLGFIDFFRVPTDRGICHP